MIVSVLTFYFSFLRERPTSQTHKDNITYESFLALAIRIEHICNFESHFYSTISISN